MTDDDQAKYIALVERLRIISKSMNQHEQDEETILLYTGELERITAELGRLTGADQEPDWPK